MAMAWTKLKTSIVAGAVILLVAAGITALALKVMPYYRGKAQEKVVWSTIGHLVDNVTQSKDLWRTNFESIQSVSNVVFIRPTQLAAQVNDGFLQNVNTRVWLGVAMPMNGLFGHAYDIRRNHIANPELLPSGKYDFVVTGPDHRMEALQAALKNKFGLTAMRVMRQTNVLLLTVANTNAPGLHPKPDHGDKRARFFSTGTSNDDGHIKYCNRDMDFIVKLLERHLNTPVFDQTKLRGQYHIVLDDDETDLDTINQSLLNQLGLQLKPDTQMMEMLQLLKVK